MEAKPGRLVSYSEQFLRAVEVALPLACPARSRNRAGGRPDAWVRERSISKRPGSAGAQHGHGGRRPLRRASRHSPRQRAAALQVERVNIWMFDRERTRIRCIQAYERGVNRHTQGDEILASVAPSYFAALAELRTVAAFDALNDPRTRELAGYLQPRGITTLLDAPLYQGGELAGVVCHEHVGPPRQWSADEQAFAGSVGTSSPWPSKPIAASGPSGLCGRARSSFRAVGDRLPTPCSWWTPATRPPSPVRLRQRGGLPSLRLQPSELSEQPITVLADPGARGPVDEQIGRALAGEVVLFDSLHRRKDGSVMPVEVYGRAIDCAGRLTLLLLGRDISRRVRAEQAHLEFQAKVLEAQRRESLGILAGGIAHEFGNFDDDHPCPPGAGAAPRVQSRPRPLEPGRGGRERGRRPLPQAPGLLRPGPARQWRRSTFQRWWTSCCGSCAPRCRST